MCVILSNKTHNWGLQWETDTEKPNKKRLRYVYSLQNILTDLHECSRLLIVDVVCDAYNLYHFLTYNIRKCFFVGIRIHNAKYQEQRKRTTPGQRLVGKIIIRWIYLIQLELERPFTRPLGSGFYWNGLAITRR